MAVRTSFTPGESLLAQDLTDTFLSAKQFEAVTDGTISAKQANGTTTPVGKLKLVTPETKLQRGEDGLGQGARPGRDDGPAHRASRPAVPEREARSATMSEATSRSLRSSWLARRRRCSQAAGAARS